MLFRLQRFRCPCRALAVGHRPLHQGRRFSFLRTEPAAGVVPLQVLVQECFAGRRRASGRPGAASASRSRLRIMLVPFARAFRSWRQAPCNPNSAWHCIRAKTTQTARTPRTAGGANPTVPDVFRFFRYWGRHGRAHGSTRRERQEPSAAALAPARVNPCERGPLREPARTTYLRHQGILRLLCGVLIGGSRDPALAGDDWPERVPPRCRPSLHARLAPAASAGASRRLLSISNGIPVAVAAGLAGNPLASRELVAGHAGNLARISTGSGAGSARPEGRCRRRNDRPVGKFAELPRH